jgi:hypothetical protein
MPIGQGWELPEGAEPWSSFHWFQASTRGIMDLVILGEDPCWYTGHYSGRRMFPCSGEGCAFCAEGIGSQVRYVLAVVETSSRRAGLIEFGKSNGQLIRDWTARNNGLRGMRIEVSKTSKNVQSRTIVAYVEQPLEPWYLGMEVPDVALALYLTWHKAGMIMPAQFADRMREYQSGPPIAKKILDTLAKMDRSN